MRELALLTRWYSLALLLLPVLHCTGQGYPEPSNSEQNGEGAGRQAERQGYRTAPKWALEEEVEGYEGETNKKAIEEGAGSRSLRWSMTTLGHVLNELPAASNCKALRSESTDRRPMSEISLNKVTSIEQS